MALTPLQVLAASRKYTEDTIMGEGAIKGKDGKDGHDCQIVANEQITGGHRLTFSYYSGGTPHTSVVDIMDGENGHDGEDGFSPQITVKENTDSSYVLHIVTADGEYDTPNLKGADGISVTVVGDRLVFTQ